jgi:hypothetical protein
MKVVNALLARKEIQINQAMNDGRTSSYERRTYITVYGVWERSYESSQFIVGTKRDSNQSSW